MRFGKTLEALVDPAFREKYVPYKQLKKILKSCEGGGCGAADGCGSVPSAAVCTEFFCHELQAAVLNVSELIMLQMQDKADITRLANYAEVNAMAIAKITKKHCKKIGCTPELSQLMTDVCRLPGFLMLANWGFSQSIEILLAGYSCFGFSPSGPVHLPVNHGREPSGAGDPRSAISQVVVTERVDPQTSSSSEDPSRHAADGRMSRTGFVPDVENQQAPSPPPPVEGSAASRPQWLPSCWRSEAALLVSASLCFAVSFVVRDNVAKAVSGLIGLVVSTIFAMLLVADLDTASEPRPARFRTCVWALSSFGELLGGGRAVLTAEEVGIAGAGEAVARAPTAASRACPSKAFIHEPRVELGTCACCMDDFGRATAVAVPPCGHIFCEPCLRSWAAADRRNGGHCPVCRTSFELEEV